MTTSRVRGGGRKPAFPEPSAEEKTIRPQSLPAKRGKLPENSPAPERRKAGLAADRSSALSSTSSQLTDLLLHLRGLVRRRSGQDAWVAEAGAQQGEQHKQEEDAPDGRYAAGQVLDQEGTAGTF